MNASYVKFFFIIPCGCPSTPLRMPRLVPSRKLPPLNKKMPDAERFSIGLWNVGIIHHDFLSVSYQLTHNENSTKNIIFSISLVGLAMQGSWLAFKLFCWHTSGPYTVVKLNTWQLLFALVRCFSYFIHRSARCQAYTNFHTTEYNQIITTDTAPIHAYL